MSSSGRLKSQSSDYYTAMKHNGKYRVQDETISPEVVMTKYVDDTTPRDQQQTQGVADDEESEKCGWGPFKLSFLQKFRNPKWILFWLCWAGAIQGMVVNGFINVVISSIERRYDLSSTETGIIASCYDIASVICLIPVSYFGGLGRKPRYLGIGVFFMAIGSFVFSLPHFTAGQYEVIEGGDMLCNDSINATTCDTDSSLSSYKYVFFLAQLLHGAGATPLYTLGTTYLDENLPLRSSSLYIGIYYAFAIVGPAVGYLAGGAFLDFYVDIDTVDNIPLLTTSPRFVGAWWIGFLLSGALGLMVAFPLSLFPRNLPGSAKFKAEREAEVYSNHNNGHVSPHNAEEVKKLSLRNAWYSFKVLLTNPTFMFLNLAAACEGNVLAGFATFAPKFIEAQFSLQSSTAAQYVGYAVIPAGGGGTFLGGFLVKKFDLHVRGIIRLCLGVTLPVLVLALVFLVHCDNVPFAGVNKQYGQPVGNGSVEFHGKFESHHCNMACNCKLEDYNPVCGVDGVMYYSPCYAGCNAITSRDEPVRYGNCSCLAYIDTGTHDYLAEQGKCESTCAYLPLFMPVFTLIILLTFTASMPALSATLRCVPHHQRSIALGIQWIIARCLGSIPGPILFGKMIDITCRLWQSNCDEQGSCFFYDNKSMSYNLLGVALSAKFCSALFFFLALVFYKMPKKPKENVNQSDSRKESNLTALGKNNQSVDTLTTSVQDEVVNGDVRQNGGNDLDEINKNVPKPDGYELSKM